jgi:hypothetical protein
MTQTGYWVVGWDGKFGEYKIGRQWISDIAQEAYWNTRGYKLVPCFVAEQDLEKWEMEAAQ